MKITETVPLPDPELQPLVHPLDLPDARRDFRLAFWVRALTSPGTALVIAGLTWFFDENWVRPVIVFLLLAIIGYFAAAWSDRQAWSYIPRKRRDRARRVPFLWSFAASLIAASLLTLGIVLVVRRLALGRGEIALGVNEYVVGMGAAVVALSIVVTVIRFIRDDDKRAVAFTIPSTVGVLLGVMFGYWALFREYPTMWPDFQAGALIMFGAGAIVGIWKLVEQRRSRETA